MHQLFLKKVMNLVMRKKLASKMNLDLEAIIRELETEINEEDDAYDEKADKSP